MDLPRKPEFAPASPHWHRTPRTWACWPRPTSSSERGRDTWRREWWRGSSRGCPPSRWSGRRRVPASVGFFNFDREGARSCLLWIMWLHHSRSEVIEASKLGCLVNIIWQNWRSLPAWVWPCPGCPAPAGSRRPGRRWPGGRSGASAGRGSGGRRGDPSSQTGSHS